jgi:hypothetical protein
MRLRLLHGLERSQCLVKEMVNNEPRGNGKDQDERQLNAQSNPRRLLPAFDGGDDRRAALGTSPRMVANVSAAFVTFNEGHNFTPTSRWFAGPAAISGTTRQAPLRKWHQEKFRARSVWLLSRELFDGWSFQKSLPIGKRPFEYEIKLELMPETSMMTVLSSALESWFSISAFATSLRYQVIS